MLGCYFIESTEISRLNMNITRSNWSGRKIINVFWTFNTLCVLFFSIIKFRHKYLYIYRVMSQFFFSFTIFSTFHLLHNYFGITFINVVSNPSCCDDQQMAWNRFLKLYKRCISHRMILTMIVQVNIWLCFFQKIIELKKRSEWLQLFSNELNSNFYANGKYSWK